MKAEFTLVRVINALVHRKRVVPVIGRLAAAAAFSRSLRFMPLCATIADRLIIHINMEQQMPVFVRCSSSS
jgi:hypothetical protein